MIPFKKGIVCANLHQYDQLLSVCLFLYTMILKHLEVRGWHKIPRQDVVLTSCESDSSTLSLLQTYNDEVALKVATIPLLRAEGTYCEFSRSFSLLFVSQSCGWRIIPYDPLLLLLSCHRQNLERGGKSLNPSQTALCLLCGTSPTVRWGVKGRQWEKEISQYHKHIIVTVFTAYA